MNPEHFLFYGVQASWQHLTLEGFWKSMGCFFSHVVLMN